MKTAIRYQIVYLDGQGDLQRISAQSTDGATRVRLESLSWRDGLSKVYRGLGMTIVSIQVMEEIAIDLDLCATASMAGWVDKPRLVA